MELLLKNDVLKNLITDKQERVLWVEAVGNICITIALDTKKLIIKKRMLSDIKEDLKSLKITVTKEDLNHRISGNLSEKESKLLDDRWEVVKYILSNVDEPDIFLPKKRSTIIKDAAKTFDLSIPAIYKYLRLFWQGGSNKRALLSERYKCGGRNKHKELAEKKTGRPNSVIEIQKRLKIDIDTKKAGRNITDSDKKTFGIIIDKYLRNPKISTPKAYQYMLEDYYSIKIDGQAKPEILPAEDLPTLRQFRYWVDILKEENQEKLDIERDRVGWKNFDANCSGLNSTTSFESAIVGFLMQIDSTRPPFHLLNRFKTDTIGTPIVYSIVDTFSKLICAIYVTLENPSRKSALSAILNLLEDKVDYCSRYGIEISSDDWPNSGLPRYLLADRGEFAGRFSDELVDYLEIGIQNTRSWAGNMKGDVEQSFNLLEEELLLLPGLIESDYRERGAPDYRKGARLTLKEFTKAVIIAARKVNSRRMDNFILTEEMQKDKVAKTPIAIYKWGVEHYSNAMKSVSEQIKKEIFFSKDKASVTEKGIEFNNRIYTCQRSIDEQWNSTASNFGSWEIEIRFNDQNMDSIYLVDNKKNTLIKCDLHKKYEDYRGMSYDEIYMELLFSNKEKLEDQDRVNDINSATHSDLKALIKEANDSFEAMNPSGVVNVKNSKEMRQKEIEETIKRNTQNNEGIIYGSSNEVTQNENKLVEMMKLRRGNRHA